MRRDGQPADSQKLTVRLAKDVLRRARILAVKRGTSVIALVADTIGRMVEEDEAYESARTRAMTWLRYGFRLAGKIRARREDWHER